jgi:Protein of unknown function (DUF3606)
MDDKTETRPPDSSPINISEYYEVAHWTKRIGVMKQQLHAVVNKAGGTIAAAEKELSIAVQP